MAMAFKKLEEGLSEVLGIHDLNDLIGSLERCCPQRPVKRSLRHQRSGIQGQSLCSYRRGRLRRAHQLFPPISSLPARIAAKSEMGIPLAAFFWKSKTC